MCVGGYCLQCEQKDVEIERLKLKLERLENMIARIKSVLIHTIRLIDKNMKEAKIIISQPSGVPRGIWAFSKGVIRMGTIAIVYLKHVLQEVEKC